MTEPDDDLEEQVAKLAIGVVGLRGALDRVGNALQTDVETIQTEIDTQRRLAKYARRTWFEVMAWITLLAVMAGDLRGTYCDSDSSPTGGVAAACNTVFWLTQHGDASYWWRVFGGVLMATGLIVLAKRSQVPPDLLRRTPSYSEVGRKRWRW